MKKLTVVQVEIMFQESRRLRNLILESPVPGDGRIVRSCGSCVECCDCLAIESSGDQREFFDADTEEFDKKGGVRCEHAKGGCGIYERRPMSCRGYACLWLLGWGKRNQRPDKTGVLIDDYMDVDPMMLMSSMFGSIPCCFATECRPGLFPSKSTASTKASDYPDPIPEVARDRVVMLRWYGDGHPSFMVGPDKLIVKMNAADREWVRRGM